VIAAREYDPFSYEIDEDPYPTYKWMRDEAPVYYNERLDFYALTRFEDNLAAFLDPETYSSTHSTSLEFMDGPKPNSGLLIWMDPPEHNRYRALLSKAFTPRQIGTIEEEVRTIAVGHLDKLIGRDRFDAVKEFTSRLPMDVISSLLGIPEPDRRWLQEQSNMMLHRDAGDPMPRQEALDAQSEVHDYIHGQMNERRAKPRDDMMTRLTEVELTDEEGNRQNLRDHDIKMFIVLLATAGNETVTKLLAGMYLDLWHNPGERDRLLADRDLVPNAVEEGLRYETPSQYQGRVTLKPVDVAGETIPAGARVLLINAAANRDERKFPDPDRFDVGREIDLHLGLGYGRHVCLGAYLARMESRIGIEELLSRFPAYRIPDNGIERMHSSNVRGLSGLMMEVG
jgi:cytochrome P450